ncbi:Bll2645 protein [Olavius sp. associated proteobacterium Delta 1]|nr:Bll2645 protein [Olavius sp. associated proteobacterium Delta 1]
MDSTELILNEDETRLRDAGDATLMGQYDLVTAFECIHDMSDPVGALQTMLELAGEKGTVIIMDERVGDRFSARGSGVEWMMYGWSVLHCLPVGKDDHHSAETGTVMRAGTLKRFAEKAGFCDVEVLPIDNFFFRFYRLNPVCTLLPQYMEKKFDI